MTDKQIRELAAMLLLRGTISLDLSRRLAGGYRLTATYYPDRSPAPVITQEFLLDGLGHLDVWILLSSLAGGSLVANGGTLDAIPF